MKLKDLPWLGCLAICLFLRLVGFSFLIVGIPYLIQVKTGSDFLEIAYFVIFVLVSISSRFMRRKK